MELLRSISEKWKAKVIQGYGLTESTNFSCTMPIDLSDSVYNKVMFPYPSIGVTLDKAKITSSSNKAGALGELSISSPSNFLGYWAKEPIGAKKIVKTGDLGYFSIIAGKKFYYLKGRTKELINRGGEKHLPIEIEAKLRLAGLKNEFAVISIPDEKFGEEIGLVVIKKFNEKILEKLPNFIRPKKVFYVKKLFYTPTGKVQRIKLSNFVNK